MSCPGKCLDFNIIGAVHNVNNWSVQMSTVLSKNAGCRTAKIQYFFKGTNQFMDLDHWENSTSHWAGRTQHQSISSTTYLGLSSCHQHWFSNNRCSQVFKWSHASTEAPPAFEQRKSARGAAGEEGLHFVWCPLDFWYATHLFLQEMQGEDIHQPLSWNNTQHLLFVDTMAKIRFDYLLNMI